METCCLKTYLDFKKKGFNGAHTQHINIEKTEQDTPAPRPQEADLPMATPRWIKLLGVVFLVHVNYYRTIEKSSLD